MPLLELRGPTNLTAIAEDDVTNSGTLVSALISSPPRPGERCRRRRCLGHRRDGRRQHERHVAVHDQRRHHLARAGRGLQHQRPPARRGRDHEDPLRPERRLQRHDRRGPHLPRLGSDQRSINGSLASTTPNGGTTAFSLATDTASQTVNPVNDAPRNLTATPDTQMVQYSDAIATVTLTAIDIDSPATALTATTSWKKSTDAGFISHHPSRRSHPYGSGRHLHLPAHMDTAGSGTRRRWNLHRPDQRQRRLRDELAGCHDHRLQGRRSDHLHRRHVEVHRVRRRRTVRRRFQTCRR